MNGDKLGSALFGLFCDAGHCEVIDAHPVGKPDALVFDRGVVVMVVTSEESG